MTPRSSLFLAALASGCATVAARPTDAVSAAARTPELSTLSRLIQKAGLADTLRAAGPYTVFAPSNEAFAAVPAKTLEELSRNKEQLKTVLSYHALPAKVSAAEVQVGNARTVQGANLAMGRAGSMVTVEDAMVLRADVPAGNGVVHVIDRVLMPPRH